MTAWTSAAAAGWFLPQHLGSLHPVEQVLTLVLAFGPFLVLGVVVTVRRRQDAAEDENAPPDRADPAERGGAGSAQGER